VIPDVIASATFLSKQHQRKKLNAAALQALETRIHEKTSEEERVFASPREFFQGFWDFLLSLIVLLFLFELDQHYFFHPLRRPSVYRETFYEFMVLTFTAMPYFVALAVRASTVPKYEQENGCTGCIIDQTDIIICGIINGVLVLPIMGVFYKVRAFNIPDPLHSVRDMAIG
jgi:hypothetical protein